LPARWRVVFHAPVHPRGDRRAVLADGALSARPALEVERTVQGTLERLAWRRPLAHVSSWLAERASGRDARPHGP
jgi:hypothetical protein